MVEACQVQKGLPHVKRYTSISSINDPIESDATDVDLVPVEQIKDIYETRLSNLTT